MSNKVENICRLCLKVAEKKFEIDETVKQMCEILLIKLDLGVTRNPIICQDCMQVGKKCLSFKYTYIDTEKFILLYSADRKKLKVNIRGIYEERKHMQIVSDEDFNTCRICMTRLKRNNFVSFDPLINKSMFEMLSKYMVEMDFNTIENPIICANCKENFDSYVKFLQNCLDIEEKIKAYCIEKATDRADKVRLGDVLQFALTDILEYPDKCFKTYKIKQGHIERAYTEAYKVLIKQEELVIKDEGTILNENSYGNTSEFNLQKNGDKFLSKKYINETKSDMISQKTKGHNTEGYKCSNMRAGKHVICTDETKETENIKTVIQKDTQNFQSNITVYRSMFKCALCAYQSKRKSSLRYHILVHKDVSETAMFKCSFCTYETRHKRLFKSHMLVHKDVSEVKMFKCKLCCYESKRKNNLESHILNHKDVSEVKMFKCKLCCYESKRKSNFESHILIHKDVSEVKMFKCNLCPYESKQKYCLTGHMLVHQDVSKIKIFECPSCPYKGKRKRDLNSHMMVHKDFSEIKALKCKLCSYKCKHRYSFTKHMLVRHKDDL